MTVSVPQQVKEDFKRAIAIKIQIALLKHVNVALFYIFKQNLTTWITWPFTQKNMGQHFFPYWKSDFSSLTEQQLGIDPSSKEGCNGGGQLR